jgi:hypothetical protein
MENKRSIGVTLFGIYFILRALAVLFFTQYGLVVNLWRSNLKDNVTIAGAVTAIMAILLLILGISILRLKEWAR